MDFGGWNSRFMGSDTIRGIDVCPRLSVVSRGLATLRPLVQLPRKFENTGGGGDSSKG